MGWGFYSDPCVLRIALGSMYVEGCTRISVCWGLHSDPCMLRDALRSIYVEDCTRIPGCWGMYTDPWMSRESFDLRILRNTHGSLYIECGMHLHPSTSRQIFDDMIVPSSADGPYLQLHTVITGCHQQVTGDTLHQSRLCPFHLASNISFETQYVFTEHLGMRVLVNATMCNTHPPLLPCHWH